jgi:hypothetical protein
VAICLDPQVLQALTQAQPKGVGKTYCPWLCSLQPTRRRHALHDQTEDQTRYFAHRLISDLLHHGHEHFTTTTHTAWPGQKRLESLNHHTGTAIAAQAIEHLTGKLCGGL